MAMEINGSLIVDTAFSESRGTFRAASTQVTGKPMKLKVNTRTYDMTEERAFETFPLASGSGRYTVVLYRQRDDTGKFVRVGCVRFTVRLQREDAAFLNPNQWVQYDALSPWILAAHQMCEGLSGNAAYEAIRLLVDENLRFDYIKALKSKYNERPDLERCWEVQMGTSLDLASIAASMMRVRCIPAQLVVGTVGKSQKPHAWVLATVENRLRLYDPAAEIRGIVLRRYAPERRY